MITRAATFTIRELLVGSIFVMFILVKLEWVSNCHIKNQILTSPGRISEGYLIDHPPVIFFQPWFSQGHGQIKTQHKVGYIHPQPRSCPNSQFIQETGQFEGAPYPRWIG